jgi:G:T/U-mismatch repair DNA glycosylase
MSEKRATGFEPFIPDGCRCLIVGSFQPIQRDINFFYPNRNNQFWQMIEGCPSPFEDLEETKDFLKERKIGFINIIKESVRLEGNASDVKLLTIETEDIESILETNQAIERIITTGKRAFNELKKQLEFSDAKNKETIKFAYGNITIFKCPSTSTAYWRISLKEKQQAYQKALKGII